MELQWKKATGKLPEYQVLAVGYQDEMVVGFLCRRTPNEVSCESETELLSAVRYYIPVRDLRKTVPKETK